MNLDSSMHGVYLTELRQIADDRGAVLHMLRSDAAEFEQFGECYFSEICPGHIKAWKRHERQTQNIAVPVGRVRFVLLDHRQDSASHGNLYEIELGRPDSYYRLRIPPGIVYGFACLSQETALIANCSDEPHDPSESVIVGVDELDYIYSWDTEQHDK